MQKITPNLGFDNGAEAAVDFYTSLFDRSSIGAISRYDEAAAAVSAQPEGSVLTVEFELEGQQFVALNGDPSSRSPQLPHSSSTARRETRSTSSGQRYRRVVRR